MLDLGEVDGVNGAFCLLGFFNPLLSVCGDFEFRVVWVERVEDEVCGGSNRFSEHCVVVVWVEIYWRG